MSPIFDVELKGLRALQRHPRFFDSLGSSVWRSFFTVKKDSHAKAQESKAYLLKQFIWERVEFHY